MPAITSLGIGSGADLSGLVNQLVAVERQPLQQMRTAASGLQTQVSSYGRVSSLLSGLQTAASKLNNAALWSQSSVRSSDDTAVAVSGGSGAAAGNYSVSVSKLASSQTVVTATSLANANSPVGSGTLTLELGEWEQQPLQFVPHVGRDPTTVSVEPEDTLTTLRDKINATGSGVTASLVTDSSGVRLSLRSTESGKENGFRVQVTDNDGAAADDAGLSRFAFDPANGTTGTELKQSGANAQAVVNGIPVSSAKNELTGVVEGVTFKLRKENFGSAEVSVSSDTDNIKKSIQAFADSYNELSKNINELTRYDPTSRQGGPLQGDSAVGSIQRQLRGLINSPSGASSSFSRMSDLGLQLQRDGTLSVNSVKLDAALERPAELKRAFSNLDSENTGNSGFARRYVELASQVLGTDGTLTTRTQGLQKQLTTNSEAQARLSDRVDRFQQRLVQQYTALDGNLARLNSLSSSVTQALRNLSANSSNN